MLSLGLYLSHSTKIVYSFVEIFLLVFVQVPFDFTTH